MVEIGIIYTSFQITRAHSRLHDILCDDGHLVSVQGPCSSDAAMIGFYGIDLIAKLIKDAPLYLIIGLIGRKRLYTNAIEFMLDRLLFKTFNK